MKLKQIILAILCVQASIAMAQQKHKSTIPLAGSNTFHMGGISPSDERIDVNSYYMSMNGKPGIPVMGEIHYSRCAESEWRTELQKMKAGGINVIATYVFWIHHEEEEGVFNWSGNRNLHKFISLCGELGLKVILRSGPWCHGECRNGGFPEWLVTRKNIKLRSNDQVYLKYVERLYGEIFQQVKGLLWKDGGPVIGMQFENEYGGPWEHLVKLKEIALKIGFNLPFYTRTGWPSLSTPATFGEIIPLYGDYADGFWDRELTEMPGDYSKVFLFKNARNSTVIATEQLPKQSANVGAAEAKYPYFTCELGGGMMPSYHRRINIDPMDVYATAICKLGSGSNLLGYYMYHGGTNPEGKFTPMNESQNSLTTNWNDLPQKTYDFQAPLGEFGQVNEQYHLLRRLHLFLQDFGSELALMNVTFPSDNPTDIGDINALRWSIRSNEGKGYVFVNNYQRLAHLPAKDNVRFTVRPHGGKLTFPENAIQVPSDKCFFFPFNFSMGTSLLISATAQPVCRIEENGTTRWYFSSIDGIRAEFQLSTEGIKQIDYSSVLSKLIGSKYLLNDLVQGLEPTLCFTDTKGHKHQIILTTEEQSLHIWKGEINQRQQVVISEIPLVFETDSVRYLPSRQYPNTVKVVPVKEAGAPRIIAMGVNHVAEQPYDKDFEQAAVWQIELPVNRSDWEKLLLRINYVGDVARLYIGDKLVDDNFYNGKSFDFALKSYINELRDAALTLHILGMPHNPPIYLQKEARENLSKTSLSLKSLELIKVTY